MKNVATFISLAGLLVVACGSPSGTQTTISASRPSTSASASASDTPSPAPPVYPTVLSHETSAANGQPTISFYSSATGALVGAVKLPGTDPLRGHGFGDGYFGFSTPSGKEPGQGGGDVHLVEVDAGAGPAVLQTIGNDVFVDAMGDADGTAYAWLEQGTEYICSGNTPEGATDLYVAATGGAARKVTSLPDLGHSKPWQFYTWAASTLVLAEGLSGCEAGLDINHQAKDFVNLSTGAITPAASVTGADCVLQSVSWTGTTVCSGEPANAAAPDSASIVVGIIHADGTRLMVPLSAFNVAVCPSTRWGYVRVSPDGTETLVTVNDSNCRGDPTYDEAKDRNYVVDNGTGAVHPIPVGDSTGVEFGTWTGAHTPIIESYQGTTETLFSVGADGTSTTKLVSFPQS